LHHLKQDIEEQLVINLKRNDIQAFNELFGYYGPRLYHFSYRYIRSESECEELVQEVFTRVWEKRSELKEDLSFRSYIFTIAFNIIRKYFRSRILAKSYYESGMVDDFQLETSQKINFNSLKGRLDGLVSMLPLRRREIFMKSRMEGLSIREIADEMQISKKTVENQLTEALKFIRNHLTGERMAGILFLYLFIQ
jgi:RNA polymerase sigma-70 factor (ECF subfamily)